MNRVDLYLPGFHRVHNFGETERKRRNAERMARGGRIALFDCGYRSANEAFEEPLNFVVEFAVFVSHRGLRRE